MKKNSTKKNLIYNLIYQILILIIPLVTAPYLSRTLGVKSIGTYSYTYTIVYYFMLMSLLGVNNYGNRKIAKTKNDKMSLSHQFWGIYIIQLISSILMISIYILFLIFVDSNYKEISTIQIIYLFSTILDINWYFFGREKFKITIIRNIVVKIFTMLLIFLFVRDSNDIQIYTFIMAGMTVLSQLCLWPHLFKEIKFIHLKEIKIKNNLKPIIILFIPVIAISLYKLMDKLMLGTLSSIEEVGYYENAEKIISICFILVNAIGTVMMPRISNLILKKDNSKIQEYFNKSLNFVMFLTLPLMFGLICCGTKLSVWYYGDDFFKTGIILTLLSITIPIASWSTIIRTQVLLPYEKDKEYLISVCCGALINFAVNLILINKYGAIGACIGTIIAELIVMIIQTCIIKKYIHIFSVIKKSINYFIKSIIMFVTIYMLGYINFNSAILLVIQIVFGIVIYCLLNYKLICKIFGKLILMIRSKIKNDK